MKPGLVKGRTVASTYAYSERKIPNTFIRRTFSGQPEIFANTCGDI